MMKFFFTPGSCSTGIHILLEELGLVFEAHIVNLLAGDQVKPDYLAINPKGSIPALLVTDDWVLTEFQAIAWWLAYTYPKAGLIPSDTNHAARAIELMDYVVGTLHGHGFARIFTTDKFTENPADFDHIKAEGLRIIEKGMAIISSHLPPQTYALGQFCIADAALFYVEFWADKSGIALPENCFRHYKLMLSRPAVKRVLMEEGYRLN